MVDAYTDAEDVGPVTSQQPLAVDFIENRALGYRTAQGELPFRFNTQKQKFVDRDIMLETTTISHSIDEEQLRASEQALMVTNDKFKRAVKELVEKDAKKKTKKKGETFAFDLEAVHDWAGACQALESAISEYEDDKTVNGKVRKAFRRISDNAESIQSFVGLLPGGNYKTLCGRLTLILTAMKSHAQARDWMADLLDSIPNFLQVDNIYVGLLSAIVDMILWYKGSSKNRIINCLVKNSQYAQSIGQHLERIESSRTMFQNEADKYLHWQTAQIRVGVETANQEIYEVKSILNGLCGILRDCQENAQWSDRVRKEKEELKAENDKLSRKNMNHDRELWDLRAQLTQSSYMPNSLAKLLDIDLKSTEAIAGMDAAQRQGISESLNFQSRSRWAASSQEFQNWVSSARSEALTIQGHAEMEKVSPLSFLISLLHDQLKRDRRTLILSFFCGLRAVNPFESGSSGPLIMMRSLLTQLLARQDIDWNQGPNGLPLLSFLNHEDMLKMQEGSYRAYSRAISTILLRIGERYDAVFLIIDGVDYYDLQWDRKIKQLTKSVTKLVDAFNVEEEGEAAVGTLKVLLTAASYSRSLASADVSMTQIDMPEDIERDGDGFEALNG